MKTTVDARGQVCPKPVMLTKAALDAEVDSVEVLVDNTVSASNVRRFLGNAGWQTEEEGTAPRIIITARRGKSAEPKNEEASAGAVLADESLLIATATLGGGDKALGEVLMKAFLGTVAQRSEPPRTVALMNEAVTLTLEEHSACESLKALQDRGVRLLVCGTCTNHFGITERVSVGTISNMFEITEALFAAAKRLSIG